MNVTRSIFACAALLTATSSSLPALGKEPDPAALFDRGLADMEAGRYETGCPAIEESYKVDPLPGTLFTLAECEAKRGRTATAFARYDEYLALYATLSPQRKARQGDRERVARAQEAALDAEVPELTLALPPDAPDGTAVTRDGVAVQKADLGVPIRVDPGEHVIVTSAPGRPPSTVRVSIAPRERKNLALVIPSAARPAPVVAPPRSWRLATGISAIGVGAAFVVTGIVSALQVNSINNDPTYNAYMAVTPHSSVCQAPPPGAVADDCSRGHFFEKLQLASFPLAAVFGGVGIYLVATHKPRSSPATNVALVPSVGPRSAGLGATLPF